MSPYLVINTTSLFFHNHRFETPATKKNVPHEIEGWTQGLAPPPSKRQRTSAANSIHPAPSNIHSASLNANPILMKTALPPTAAITKSAPYAIVVGSTTEVLAEKKKSVRGTKHQAEDLESVSDADNEGTGTVSNSYYGVPDEDKDDTLEQINAASSPIKALAAAQMIKVSPWQNLQVPDNLTSHHQRRALIYIAGSQLLSNRRNPPSDEAMGNSPTVHLMLGGGRPHLSQHFSDMSLAQTMTSGPSNRRTLSMLSKQFGTWSTKEMPTSTG